MARSKANGSKADSAANLGFEVMRGNRAITALKGRNVKAQGNALGTGIQKIPQP